MAPLWRMGNNSVVVNTLVPYGLVSWGGLGFLKGVSVITHAVIYGKYLEAHTSLPNVQLL